MDNDDLNRLAGNPGHIPGIYNYCDRWCERCPFTARCGTYAMGAELEAEHGDADINVSPDTDSEVFLQQISDAFDATFDLVEEIAEEQDIDLDAIDDEEIHAAMERREKHRESAREDELTRGAQRYAEMVNAWFIQAEPAFAEKGIELEKPGELEIVGLNVNAAIADLNDAVEVILWYEYQIQVKLMRAISSYLNELDDGFEWMEEEEAMAEFEDGEYEEAGEGMAMLGKDSDGSAKVALIGMDRSIVAWSDLLMEFPDHEEGVFAILVQIDRLRRAAERRFPDARAFVRPGFDEPGTADNLPKRV